MTAGFMVAGLVAATPRHEANVSRWKALPSL